MDSRIFIQGDSNEIGRYEEPNLGSLSGLHKGIIFDFFHIGGMLLFLNDRLKSFVKNVMPNGPRFLR